MTTAPLTPERARTAVDEALRAIVPDADLGEVGPDESLREAFELDSIDFLAFVRRLSETTGTDIAEDDYDRLVSLSACVGFLTGRR